MLIGCIALEENLFKLLTNDVSWRTWWHLGNPFLIQIHNLSMELIVLTLMLGYEGGGGVILAECQMSCEFDCT